MNCNLYCDMSSRHHGSSVLDMYVKIRVCVYLYVCIYIHIYTHKYMHIHA